MKAIALDPPYTSTSSTPHTHTYMILPQKVQNKDNQDKENHQIQECQEQFKVKINEEKRKGISVKIKDS